MSILVLILSVVASAIAFLLIAAVFVKKEYITTSEIIINASRQKVFDYIKQIKNQETFSKWVMMDPNMKKEFKGTDGTVGFIYRWNGNKKAGEGEQEIITINEGKSIEIEIRFVRPIAGVAKAKMTTESISSNQTKIIWSTAAPMKYPLNIMIAIAVKMLEKDMTISLTTLKNILEK